MFEVRQTAAFRRWFDGLRDRRARDRVTARLRRVQHGSFGDHKGLGAGLSELRIDHGPGYRLYYTVRGRVVVLLLVGGTKATQQQDIARARALMADETDGA
jgi:putative addiction module killer protein